MVFKKRNLVCLLLLLVAVTLWASEPLVSSDQVSGYEISSYHFSIKGKTKEFALRNAIIPDGPEPIFITLEDFKQALDAKKQILDNKRIFSSVSFSYELTSFSKGIAYYDVYFTIVDSFTLLPIPYAKYDNDAIGLRVGMKIYDKNLFGTFADLYIVGHISQGNGGLDGWDNRQDYLEMSVDSLPLGSSQEGCSPEKYFRNREDTVEI
ncbi:hypothetical protein [uncultured Sphaerochaeta sp.]|uniref:hypothetical protein n=1 Tax=uncultured Sphaerochaeta sp. TaxID=886478 RepID=UPI002A0A3239|nr:hypothetical protein [uncultured Sphaerochaeta sp.]